ncbi:MAG: 1-deoxy-D-xylulose-5-phosphate synthase [Buchananella hordeovulneris]|nr:1-deoxy-D-xylulose-5-phosphate synthase [Buchananella hordeovulneris]
MALLTDISSHADLRRLTSVQLRALAQEIRSGLVESVSRTGGHLGPNLGVVELTIALHRVFDSPKDTMVFDTGHQAYVHKLLTGRHDFSTLRQPGGLSGYPSRAESEHDVVENSHASTSLSWADGIALARSLGGQADRWTVAVIGDGALTGGMAWEALNNIADHPDSKLVIVVNDNGRSYAPTIGGLAHHLDALRTNPSYESFMAWGKKQLQHSGPVGRVTYDALHGLKKGVKDVFAPQVMFEDLGIKYVGPVDGHDITELEFALTRAREYGKPVIVHVITEKGRGYTPAEEDVVDRFHAVGVIHPETGLPVAPSRFGWTSVFADEIKSLAGQREDLIGITAAMLAPVGLAPFAEAYPQRVVDVGIAEQHAVTAAAGMAYAGLTPVVALYATFLNRGLDQVLFDVGLHGEHVVFCLDRAGITGDDGPSHNGVWDIALLGLVPGITIRAPRDEQTMREALRAAVAGEGPQVVRYPKGALPPACPAVESGDGFDVLKRAGRPLRAGESEAGALVADVAAGAVQDAGRSEGGAHESQGAGTSSTSGEEAQPQSRAADAGERLLIVSMGPLWAQALEAAAQLEGEGLQVEVVDPLVAVPLSAGLVEHARSFDYVVTIEDGLAAGGAGEKLRAALPGKLVACLGVAGRFPVHNTRAALLAEMGMSAEGIVRAARTLRDR